MSKINLLAFNEYIVSVFCIMVLPLLPLLVEYIISNKVQIGSLVLSTSMYSISIGVSSKWTSFLILGATASIFFACAYGSLIQTATPTNLDRLCYVAIFGIMSIHAIERYQRHFKDGEKYFDFYNTSPTQKDK